MAENFFGSRAKAPESVVSIHDTPQQGGVNSRYFSLDDEKKIGKSAVVPVSGEDGKIVGVVVGGEFDDSGNLVGGELLQVGGAAGIDEEGNKTEAGDANIRGINRLEVYTADGNPVRMNRLDDENFVIESREGAGATFGRSFTGTFSDALTGFKGITGIDSHDETAAARAEAEREGARGRLPVPFDWGNPESYFGVFGSAAASYPLSGGGGLLFGGAAKGASKLVGGQKTRAGKALDAAGSKNAFGARAAVAEGGVVAPLTYGEAIGRQQTELFSHLTEEQKLANARAAAGGASFWTALAGRYVGRGKWGGQEGWREAMQEFAQSPGEELASDWVLDDVGGFGQYLDGALQGALGGKLAGSVSGTLYEQMRVGAAKDVGRRVMENVGADKNLPEKYILGVNKLVDMAEQQGLPLNDDTITSLSVELLKTKQIDPDTNEWLRLGFREFLPKIIAEAVKGQVSDNKPAIDAEVDVIDKMKNAVNRHEELDKFFGELSGKPVQTRTGGGKSGGKSGAGEQPQTEYEKSLTQKNEQEYVKLMKDYKLPEGIGWKAHKKRKKTGQPVNLGEIAAEAIKQPTAKPKGETKAKPIKTSAKTPTKTPAATPAPAPSETDIDSQYPGQPELVDLALGDLERIKVEPSRFQVKSEAKDEEGGVSKKDKIQGGFEASEWKRLLLWRDKKGDIYLAHGHHRLEAAKRWNKKGQLPPSGLPVSILDESKGVSAEQAAGLAARSNLKDGRLTAVDYYLSRKYLKDLDKLPGGEDGSEMIFDGAHGAAAYQAEGLVRLDDDAAKYVEGIGNGKVKAGYAAEIGYADLPADKQVGLMQKWSKSPPTNISQARMRALFAKTSAAVREDGDQGSLMGLSDDKIALASEVAADIVAGMLHKFGVNMRDFNALVKRESNVRVASGEMSEGAIDELMENSSGLTEKNRYMAKMVMLQAGSGGLAGKFYHFLMGRITELPNGMEKPGIKQITGEAELVANALWDEHGKEIEHHETVQASPVWGRIDEIIGESEPTTTEKPTTATKPKTPPPKAVSKPKAESTPEPSETPPSEPESDETGDEPDDTGTPPETDEENAGDGWVRLWVGDDIFDTDNMDETLSKSFGKFEAELTRRAGEEEWFMEIIQDGEVIRYLDDGEPDLQEAKAEAERDINERLGDKSGAETPTTTTTPEPVAAEKPKPAAPTDNGWLPRDLRRPRLNYGATALNFEKSRDMVAYLLHRRGKGDSSRHSEYLDAYEGEFGDDWKKRGEGLKKYVEKALASSGGAWLPPEMGGAKPRYGAGMWGNFELAFADDKMLSGYILGNPGASSRHGDYQSFWDNSFPSEDAPAFHHRQIKKDIRNALHEYREATGIPNPEKVAIIVVAKGNVKIVPVEKLNEFRDKNQATRREQALKTIDIPANWNTSPPVPKPAPAVKEDKEETPPEPPAPKPIVKEGESPLSSEEKRKLEQEYGQKVAEIFGIRKNYIESRAHNKIHFIMAKAAQGKIEEEYGALHNVEQDLPRNMSAATKQEKVNQIRPLLEEFYGKMMGKIPLTGDEGGQLLIEKGKFDLREEGDSKPRWYAGVRLTYKGNILYVRPGAGDKYYVETRGRTHSWVSGSKTKPINEWAEGDGAAGSWVGKNTYTIIQGEKIAAKLLRDGNLPVKEEPTADETAVEEIQKPKISEISEDATEARIQSSPELSLVNRLVILLGENQKIKDRADFHQMADEAGVEGDAHARENWLEVALAYVVARRADEMESDLKGAAKPMVRLMKAMEEAEKLKNLLPLQTQTPDKQATQAYSTPPDVALLAAWLLNGRRARVLEPSAGTGTLAAVLKNPVLNEWYRAEYLRAQGYKDVWEEDAGKLQHVEMGKMDGVLINPPFASEKSSGQKGSDVGYNHLKSAWDKIRPGGRMVAITGWNQNPAEMDFAKEGNVPVSLVFDGSIYRRMGANFPIRLTLIEKTKGDSKTISNKITPKVRDIEGGFTSTAEAVQFLTKSKVQRPPELEAIASEEDIDSSEESAPAPPPPPTTKPTSEPKGDSKPSAPDEDKPADKTLAEITGIAATPKTNPTKTLEQTEEETPAEDPAVNKNRVERESGGVLTTFNFVDGVLPAGMGHLKTSPSWVQTQALADIELDKDASERIKKAAAEIYLHPQIKDGSGVSAVVRGKQLPKLVPFKQQVASAVEAKAAIEKWGGFGMFFDMGLGKTITMSMVAADYISRGKKVLYVGTSQGWFDRDGMIDMVHAGVPSDKITPYETGKKVKFTEGLLFTTYSTLARKSKGDSPDKSKINENRNFKGITNLLGDDFDGLVIFDEIDKAASVGTEEGEKKKYYERGASDNYLGVQALHKKFRNAGALYGSGTAMTKDYKSALSMINLPLYGDGLSISNRHAFKEMLDTYGLPFLEEVSHRMRKMGAINYAGQNRDGVKSLLHEIKLTKEQVSISDRMAKVFQDWGHAASEAADKLSGGSATAARKKLRGEWAITMQRTVNSINWAYRAESIGADVVKLMKGESAMGIKGDGKPKSPIIITSLTGDATSKRAITEAMIKQGVSREEDLDLSQIDLSPRAEVKRELSKALWRYELDEVEKNGNKSFAPRLAREKDGSEIRVIYDFNTRKYRRVPDDIEIGVSNRGNMTNIKDISDSTISGWKEYDAKKYPNYVLQEMNVDKESDRGGRRLFDLWVKNEVLDEKAKEIEKLLDEADMPGNPIDLIRSIVDSDPATSGRFFELTGRNGWKSDGNKLSKVNDKEEMKRFLNSVDFGVAIASKKYSRGENLQDRLGIKNQAQRVLIYGEMGWEANNAIQSGGRVLREGQISKPIYVITRLNDFYEHRIVAGLIKAIAAQAALTSGNRRGKDMGSLGIDNDMLDKTAVKAFNRYRFEMDTNPHTGEYDHETPNFINFLSQLQLLVYGDAGEIDWGKTEDKIGGTDGLKTIFNRTVLLFSAERQMFGVRLMELRNELVEDDKNQGIESSDRLQLIPGRGNILSIRIKEDLPSNMENVDPRPSLVKFMIGRQVQRKSWDYYEKALLVNKYVLWRDGHGKPHPRMAVLWRTATNPTAGGGGQLDAWIYLYGSGGLDRKMRKQDFDFAKNQAKTGWKDMSSKAGMAELKKMWDKEYADLEGKVAQSESVLLVDGLESYNDFLRENDRKIDAVPRDIYPNEGEGRSKVSGFMLVPSQAGGAEIIKGFINKNFGDSGEKNEDVAAALLRDKNFTAEVLYRNKKMVLRYVKAGINKNSWRIENVSRPTMEGLDIENIIKQGSTLIAHEKSDEKIKSLLEMANRVSRLGTGQFAIAPDSPAQAEGRPAPKFNTKPLDEDSRQIYVWRNNGRIGIDTALDIQDNGYNIKEGLYRADSPELVGFLLKTLAGRRYAGDRHIVLDDRPGFVSPVSSAVRQRIRNLLKDLGVEDVLLVDWWRPMSRELEESGKKQGGKAVSYIENNIITLASDIGHHFDDAKQFGYISHEISHFLWDNADAPNRQRMLNIVKNGLESDADIAKKAITSLRAVGYNEENAPTLPKSVGELSNYWQQKYASELTAYGFQRYMEGKYRGIGGGFFKRVLNLLRKLSGVMDSEGDMATKYFGFEKVVSPKKAAREEEQEKNGGQFAVAKLPKDVVRQPDGKPTVFYHGTLNKFDKYKRNKRPMYGDDSNEQDIGVHFALDERTALAATAIKKNRNRSLTGREFNSMIPKLPPPRENYLHGNAYYIESGAGDWIHTNVIISAFNTRKTDDPFMEVFHKSRKEVGLGDIPRLPDDIIKIAEDIVANGGETDDIRKGLLEAGVDILVYPNLWVRQKNLSVVALTPDAILNTDGSAGALPEGQFAMALPEDVLKGKDKKPTPFYHGTPKKFSQYKRGVEEYTIHKGQDDERHIKDIDLGVHFAFDEKTAMIAEAFQKNKGRTMTKTQLETKLKSSKPPRRNYLRGNAYYIPYEGGDWRDENRIVEGFSYNDKPDDWGQKVLNIFHQSREKYGLGDIEKLPDEIISDLEALVHEGGGVEDIRQRLLMEGVDIIVYPNLWEGEEHISAVAINPEAILNDDGSPGALSEGQFAIAPTGKGELRRTGDAWRLRVVGVPGLNSLTSDEVANYYNQGFTDIDPAKAAAYEGALDYFRNTLAIQDGGEELVGDSGRWVNMPKRAQWGVKSVGFEWEEEQLVLRPSEPPVRRAPRRSRPKPPGLFAIAPPAKGINGKPLEAWWESEELTGWQNDPRMKGVDKSLLDPGGSPIMLFRGMTKPPQKGNMSENSFWAFNVMYADTYSTGGRTIYPMNRAYLSVKNIFDPQRPDHKKIYKKFNFHLSGSGSPGWVEGTGAQYIGIENLVATLEANYPGRFDAIWVDEGNGEESILVINPKNVINAETGYTMADDKDGQFALVPPENAGIAEETIYKAESEWNERLDGDYSPEAIAAVLDDDPDFVERVWQETGIILAKDGKFRAEISDDWLTDDFVVGIIKQQGEWVARHYSVPPVIRAMNVWIDIDPARTFNTAWAETPNEHTGRLTIDIGGLKDDEVEKGQTYAPPLDIKDKKDLAAFRSVFLHELTHIAQKWFGFSPGASFANGEDAYMNAHGEAEAREVEKRLGKSAAWRAKNPPKWDGIPAQKLIAETKRLRQQNDRGLFAMALPKDVLRDEDGQPMVVYHGTPKQFDKFNRGVGRHYPKNRRDLGVHFTPRWATALKAGLYKEFGQPKVDKMWAEEKSSPPGKSNTIVREAYLRGNVFYVAEDATRWHSGEQVGRALYLTEEYRMRKSKETGGFPPIPKRVLDKMRPLLDEREWEKNGEPMIEDLRSALIAAGVDVLAYPNDIEGEGELSFVAINPDAIIGMDGEKDALPEGQFAIVPASDIPGVADNAQKAMEMYAEGMGVEIKDITPDAVAEFTEKNKAKIKEIWQKTGMILGIEPEPQLRMEIDNVADVMWGVILQKKSKETTTLGEIADWPALFDLYPKAQDIKITFGALRASAGNQKQKGINMAVAATTNKQKWMETLDHEVQHYIQDHAGFSTGYYDRGGKYGTYKNSSKSYWYAAGEAEAREVANRRGKLASWRAANPPKWDGIPLSKLKHRDYRANKAGFLHTGDTSMPERAPMKEPWWVKVQTDGGGWNLTRRDFMRVKSRDFLSNIGGYWFYDGVGNNPVVRDVAKLRAGQEGYDAEEWISGRDIPNEWELKNLRKRHGEDWSASDFLASVKESSDQTPKKTSQPLVGVALDAVKRKFEEEVGYPPYDNDEAREWWNERIKEK